MSKEKSNYDFPDKEITLSHLPAFYGVRTPYFKICVEGKVVGSCWSYGAHGWFATDGAELFVGPKETREEIVAELLSDSPKTCSREIYERTERTANNSVFKREIVMVQTNPLKVKKAPLMSIEMGKISPWTSVAVALVQTGPRGCHAVVCDDAEMGLTQFADDHKMIPQERTVLSPDDFNDFITSYSASINNIDNVRSMMSMISRCAPAFQFVPNNLIPAALEGDTHIPRIFLRYDLSDFECLIKLTNKENPALQLISYGGETKAQKLLELGLDKDNTQFCLGAWYAVRKMETAILAKLKTSEFNVMIYEIGDL